MEKTEIIGIDHGYKNMKTAHFMFKTAISEIKETDDLKGVLEYEGICYTIYGKTVSSVETHDKSDSLEFYLLTLVAIAKELSYRERYKARVVIAAGLPVQWFDPQKESFRKKLISKRELFFRYEGQAYTISIVSAKIYMQGISAILRDSKKYSKGRRVLVDIGGETINIIPFLDGIPLRDECKISTEASIFCINTVTEKVEATFYERITEEEIISIIDRGRLETTDKFDLMVQREMTAYSKNVFRILKEFKINVERTPIVFVGGGSYIIKNFGEYGSNVEFNLDINANAKGYELAESYQRSKHRFTN